MDQELRTSSTDLLKAPEENAVTVAKYIVELPQWTGPYDLLLQVIDEQDLNLFDLNISLLLQHYLIHLEQMEAVDIDEAGEFLVVAATLAQIKSKMLLPQEERTEEEEEEDPREKLVQYLIEYQKIKQAAEQLRERPILGRDVFLKGAKEHFDGLEAEGSGKLFQLVKGFQKAILRNKIQTPFSIEMEEVSVSERFQEIFSLLESNKEIEFEDCLPSGQSKVYLIASFLAVLEMVRMKKILVLQREVDGPLFLQFKEGATAEDVVHSEFDEEIEENPSEKVAGE